MDLSAWMRFRLQTVALCTASAGIAVFCLYNFASAPYYGPPPPSPWPGIAGAGLLWLIALIPLRWKGARLWREGGKPVPRLRAWVLFGAFLFEAAMNVPMYLDPWFIMGDANSAMIFFNFGVLLAASLTGVSLLISGAPFKKRVYPLTLLILGIGFVGHFGYWAEACASV